MYGDKNLETIHIGAYISEELIGIASAFLKTCPQYSYKIGVQLRAIAVIPKFQRQGIATKLINHILKIIKTKINPDYIWLNSRISGNGVLSLLFSSCSGRSIFDFIYARIAAITR